MQAVCHVFDDIVPILNRTSNPLVKNLFLGDVKRYLTENRLKSCVLVVDAGTVKDAFHKLPQRRAEYEDLLKTAADKVGRKEFFLSLLDSMGKA